MILHLCVLDKFIEPFYQLVKENFADFYSNHQFYINGTSEKYSNPVGKNVFLAKNTKLMVRHAWLAKQMNKAEQIMLHGLLDMHVLILLCLQPWLFKKCYWVIWGHSWRLRTGEEMVWRKRGLAWMLHVSEQLVSWVASTGNAAWRHQYSFRQFSGPK